MTRKKRQPLKKKTIKTPPVPVKLTNKQKVAAFLARRPHRSFRLTRQRDYKRSLELPGYWVFTVSVAKVLWSNRKLFIWLTAIYAVLSGLLVGVISQTNYSAFSSSFKDSAAGNWGALGQATQLFISTVTGQLSDTPTGAQQAYAGLLILLLWLTTVWLLRNILAGNKIKLRDGIYNSGAPILSTFLVGLVLIAQLLPFGVAVLGYGAASSSGLLNSGIAAMLFWVAAALLATLSIYWITSTLIALVVITLPGMYPIKALRIAGDLIVGRRVRVLLRLLWMAFSLVIVWAVVMFVFILLDDFTKSLIPAIEGFPTIPVLFLLMTSISIIWISSYIYLLYRKVVADDAKPA